MASNGNTAWRIKGEEVGSCNCNWACPCQFNSNPTEGDCKAVIGYDIREGQFGDTDLSGTRFVSIVSWPGAIHEGTKARAIFADEGVIYKRHRHRYEVNNQLRRRMEDEGLVAGGTSPDERLVEMIELPDHPFYVASQFHPEFNSRPTRPEPLFREFVGAVASRAAERGDDPATAETEAEERADAGQVRVRREA